jgi:hypothetical protein
MKESLIRKTGGSPLRNIPFVSIGAVLAMLAGGCTYSLVHDNPSAPPNVVTHCQGSENIDDSSIAVVPIPVVAFLSPHTELHEIQPDDYLNRCGPPSELANRDVTLDKTNCVAASLTEILTLGIWQWCPATIAYNADVTNAPSPAQEQSGSVSSNRATVVGSASRPIP